MQDGDKYLKATARTPVALVTQDVYDAVVDRHDHR